MRRIHLFAVFTLMLGALMFALHVRSFGTPPPFSVIVVQKPRTTTPLRRIQVNAQTITALPRGKKYVVDLTQRGVKYEFDAKTSRIDFTRVMVRTARGEIAIGAFLKTMIPTDKLATFKYASQSFSIGTRPPGTLQNTSTKISKNVVCGSRYCVCQGSSDCFDMVFGGTFGGKEYCSGDILCSQDENGNIWCSCPKAQ